MTSSPPRVLHLFEQDVHVYFWEHAKGTIEIPQVAEGTQFGIFISDAALGEPADIAVEEARVRSVVERLILLKPQSVIFLGRRGADYDDMMDWMLIGDHSEHPPADSPCLTMWIAGDPSREFIRLLREFFVLTYGHSTNPSVLLML